MKDEAFLRVFTKGCVVVNSTGKAPILTLPQRCRTLAGEEVETVSLAPKRGAVLITPPKR